MLRDSHNCTAFLERRLNTSVLTLVVSRRRFNDQESDDDLQKALVLPFNECSCKNNDRSQEQRLLNDHVVHLADVTSESESDEEQVDFFQLLAFDFVLVPRLY